jgi:hypothetical protein
MQPTKKQKTSATTQKVIYAPQTDLTLTKSQAKVGGFRPDVVSTVVKSGAIRKGAFRVASNPTQDGFSSGYHESFVVTDMTDKLARRVKSSKTHSALPKEKSGYWKKQSGNTFPEANLDSLLQIGDGMRTDTARTILSGPNSTFAGHTGSGAKTTNQSQAHDILRDQSVRVLSDPLMTPDAMAVIGGATTVFSMAPGEKASRVKDVGKLKSKKALKTWEKDRNEAKRRVQQLHDLLPPSEQALVEKHMDTFVKDLGDKSRNRPKGRATSPIREISQQKSNFVFGGGYDPSITTFGAPSKIFSSGDVRAKSTFMTESFRDPRRNK